MGIRRYIAQFNPGAARRLAAALIDAGNGLAAFPERGRPVGHGRRELTTVPPYVIRYRVQEGALVVLRVRHGRRRPLPP